jgi:hypothetical protein
MSCEWCRATGEGDARPCSRDSRARLRYSRVRPSRSGRISFTMTMPFAARVATSRWAGKVVDTHAAVGALKARGVVFEEYDLHGLKTVNSIADIAGNHPSQGSGREGRLVQRQRGNLLGLGQPVRKKTARTARLQAEISSTEQESLDENTAKLNYLSGPHTAQVSTPPVDRSQVPRSRFRSARQSRRRDFLEAC